MHNLQPQQPATCVTPPPPASSFLPWVRALSALNVYMERCDSFPDRTVGSKDEALARVRAEMTDPRAVEQVVLELCNPKLKGDDYAALLACLPASLRNSSSFLAGLGKERCSPSTAATFTEFGEVTVRAEQRMRAAANAILNYQFDDAVKLWSQLSAKERTDALLQVRHEIDNGDLESSSTIRSKDLMRGVPYRISEIELHYLANDSVHAFGELRHVFLSKWRDALSQSSVPPSVVPRIPLFLMDGKCSVGAALVAKLIVHPYVSLKVRALAIEAMHQLRPSSPAVELVLSKLPGNSLHDPRRFIVEVGRILEDDLSIQYPRLAIFLYRVQRTQDQLPIIDELRLATLAAVVDRQGALRSEHNNFLVELGERVGAAHLTELIHRELPALTGKVNYLSA